MSEHRERQAHLVLRFMAKTIQERGYPPSRAEIAEHLGLSGRGATQPIIDRMREAGLIKVVPGAARAIIIDEAGMKALTEEL